MLTTLCGMSIAAPRFEESVRAYAEILGYRGGTGAFDEARARCWGCPTAAGARTARLFPQSGEPTFLELIEAPQTGYVPLTTYGWNAAEIVVQDLDALAARLSDSAAFTVIGPPATLDFDFTDAIRAMQVQGPNGEVLYLTEIGAAVPGFDLPQARTFVGRLFVAILGVARLDEARSTLAADPLGLQVGDDFQARIEVLSQAAGLDVTRRHTLATAALRSGLLEVDEFPGGSRTREPGPSGLDPGLCACTFVGEVDAPLALRVEGALFEVLPTGE